MPRGRKKDSRKEYLDAWGKLMVKVPEVTALVRYRQSLPSGMAAEWKRESVLRKATELGIRPGGEKLLDWEIPRSWLDRCIWDALRELLRVLPVLFGSITVRELLMRLSAATGWDAMLCDFVEGWAAGRAMPYPDMLHGAVMPLNLKFTADDDDCPVLVAIITPATNFDELMTDIRDQAYGHFQNVAKLPTADTLGEIVRMWDLREKGLTRSEIAWVFLGERCPEIAAASAEERKTDYKAEHSKELKRISKVIERL